MARGLLVPPSSQLDRIATYRAGVDESIGRRAHAFVETIDQIAGGLVHVVLHLDERKQVGVERFDGVEYLGALPLEFELRVGAAAVQTPVGATEWLTAIERGEVVQHVECCDLQSSSDRRRHGLARMLAREREWRRGLDPIRTQSPVDNAGQTAQRVADTSRAVVVPVGNRVGVLRVLASSSRILLRSLRLWAACAAAPGEASCVG